MKKKTKIVNYVKNGVVVRSEVVSNERTTKGWTQEEFDFLQANYMKLSAREISKELGRSWESVRGQMKRLKLTVGENRRKELQGSRRGIGSGRPGVYVWTDESVEFLKKNYQSMMIMDICAALGTKYLTVYRKMNALGLSLNKDLSKAKNQEIITSLNAKKKAYFQSPEFQQKKKAKRNQKIKDRLVNRDFSTLKKLQKQMMKDQKKIEKTDAQINKLAMKKQELRAEMKKTELKIKAMTEKLEGGN